MEKNELLDLLQQRMVEEVQDFAIILLDREGTILSWNKGAAIIKGYTKEEIVGQHFRVFYLPKAREEHLPEKLLELAKREGRAKHIGTRMRKDGTIFWSTTLITALHDNDNNVIGFTKMTRELRDSEIE